MKTWLSSSLAALLGITAARVLGSFALFDVVVGRATEILLDIGTFMLLPLVFFTLTAAIASLRKDRGATAPVFISSAAWSLLTALALSIAAGLVFTLVPERFPAAAEGASAAVEGLEAGMWETFARCNPIANTPFSNLLISPGWLLPVAFTAFVFGFAMKPSNDAIKPAYALMNSFSEVMHRLSRLMARLCWVFVFFFSAGWFKALGLSGLLENLGFSIFLGAAALASVFGLIPLLFWIFTGFKGNPYRLFARTLASSATGLFSGNILFALPALYHLQRRSAGVQKRVSGANLPFSTFFTRGGTAMISTICLCAMVYGSRGALDPLSAAAIALWCSAFSLICSWNLGSETVFVIFMASRALGLDLGGAGLVALGVLPILNGAAAFVDLFLFATGTFVAGKAIGGVVEVAYKDTL